MLLYLFSILYWVHNAVSNDSLTLAFQWTKLDFDFSSNQKRWDATISKNFIPENNLPLGLEIYEDRIFITVPRWKEGVPASLAYIRKTDRQDSPLLRPYPNWEAHNLSAPDPKIVSPFRMRADTCARLWVMDTGQINILVPGKYKSLVKPRLLIFDLKTDQLIRSYTIPDSQLKEDSFFASLAVEENNCDDSFAYLADLENPALVVYDFKQNTSWIVKHHYFNIDPLVGNMSVNKIQFTWTDGLFGLALSEKNAEGFSTLYFHPLISYNEFNVSTKVLRNADLATNQTANFHEFKLLGSRGPKGQSGASFLHKKTGVLFYALIHLNAVACWRTSLSNYTKESQGRVFLNDTTMNFPNDIKVDADDTLWVISDKLPTFMYSFLNYREYNFRIFNATVKEAIKGTACDSKMKIDHQIMKNIINANKLNSSNDALKSEMYLLILILLCITAAR